MELKTIKEMNDLKMKPDLNKFSDSLKELLGMEIKLKKKFGIWDFLKKK
jgi:hypothetical protein